MKFDKHFRVGEQYVEYSLTDYQCDTITNPTIIISLDLVLDGIGVTVDERSDVYTVGKHVPLPIPSLLSTLDTGFIRQLMSSSTRHRSRSNGKFSYTKPLDIPLKCKACHNFGYCVIADEDVCYTLAKARLYS